MFLLFYYNHNIMISQFFFFVLLRLIAIDIAISRLVFFDGVEIRIDLTFK